MSIICQKYDLLFTHVPKTGGIFVERMLMDEMGGKKVGPRHATFRVLDLDKPPSIRAFVVREPISWYRSMWAYSRSISGHRAAWPIWDTGVYHPTTELDRTCGHPRFDGFVRNVLDQFPNGFVRSMYCNFLNGTTHALRTHQLTDDLTALLEFVGFERPEMVAERPRENESPERWKRQTELPPDLEARLREVDNLEGLELKYFS